MKEHSRQDMASVTLGHKEHMTSHMTSFPPPATSLSPVGLGPGSSSFHCSKQIFFIKEWIQ